jgi:hypothetical protein
MYSQSSIPYRGSTLRSLAGDAAVIVLAALGGPAAFVAIWFCNASLNP